MTPAERKRIREITELTQGHMTYLDKMEPSLRALGPNAAGTAIHQEYNRRQGALQRLRTEALAMDPEWTYMGSPAAGRRGPKFGV